MKMYFERHILVSTAAKIHRDPPSSAGQLDDVKERERVAFAQHSAVRLGSRVNLIELMKNDLSILFIPGLF